MKRLHKAVISFGIVAVLLAGSSSAFAKSETRERAVSGAIVSIDRSTRTLTVREQGSDRTIQVRVPEGRHVRTSQVGLSFASFEQLIPGMFLREVWVEF